MSGANTVLLALQEDSIWRVQIVWPNGSVHYFGKFSSEKDACEWIINHAWLTVPVTKKTPASKDNPMAEKGGSCSILVQRDGTQDASIGWGSALIGKVISNLAPPLTPDIAVIWPS